MSVADLSTFSSNSYTTSKWINDSLKDKSEDEPIEAYLASLAMKLHILSQDYTDQLETGMVEAISTMPRVLSEISRVEEILRSVDGSMNDLAAHLRTFDQRNVSGVEDLSRLDTLKSNMEKCKATLEEHARWSQLVREAKAFLEGGGRLSDSADRIATMFWSLEILQNMPGHEERRETCEKLSDLLLSALRPRVKRDILSTTSSTDFSTLREYLYVYEKLGRKSELEEEYIQGKTESKLKGVWDNYSAATSPLAPFLTSYLNKVSQLLADESNNIIALFGVDRSSELIFAMLEHALSSTFSASLTEKLYSASPDSALEAYRATEDFAKKILSYIKPTSGSATAISASSSDKSGLEKVLSAIYGSYIVHASQHGAEIEGQFLRTKFTELIDLATFDGTMKAQSILGIEDDEVLMGPQEEDPSITRRVFSERLVAVADYVFLPTESSLNRSIAILGGTHIKLVLRAVANALSTFAKQMTAKVDELRVACGLSNDNCEIRQADKTTASSTSIAESWARRLEMFDGAGKTVIPCALRALQCAGRFARHVRTLESIVSGLLMELNVTLSPTQYPLEKTIAAAVAQGSSIGASYALFVLQLDSSASSELKSFLSASASHHVSQSAFSTVAAPLCKLKSASGSLFFDLCLSPVEKMLAELHQEVIWAASGNAESKSDNILPQSVITQVGEHLLSLVQELELFASSDALSDLLHLSGEAQALAVASKGWKKMRITLELREEDGVDNLCKRPACSSAITVAEKVMFGSVFSKLDDLDGGLTDDATDPSDDEAAAMAFVNEWLGAVSDATMGFVLGQIALVKKLTAVGRAQLIVDLDYISNVISAMGLRQHPMITHLRQLLTNEPKALQGMVEAMPARSSVSIALQKFDLSVAKALISQ